MVHLKKIPHPAIILLGVCLALGSAFELNAQSRKDGAVAIWSFDAAEERKVADQATSLRDTIEGNFRVVQGVVGKAIRFDGFTTLVRRSSGKVPQRLKSFSFEAWVAAAAYPWNWCPILTRQGADQTGFFFGIGPQGQIGLFISVDGVIQRCETVAKIPLRRWTSIVGTFEENREIRIYIDGVLSGQVSVRGRYTPATDIDLLIGMNHGPTAQSNPVRSYATLPSWFSLDGILDEVKVFDRVVSEEEIVRVFRSHPNLPEPEIKARVMPSGPGGNGRFGAYYAKLSYYDEWDDQFRVGDHSDIVVQFDSTPVRVVFWRGTRYSPAWVMENGQWMADQSAEYFDTISGCFEHMMDPHCLYSHVRIIENTAARIVVHWRYVPVSVRKQLSQPDEKTGWSDCIDEYYTFYPDGIGVRKVVQYTSGEPLGPSEAIVLCQPGTTPEDNVYLDAMTLVNMEGEHHVYSWANGAPVFKKGENPVNPVIQIVNLKSLNKPFMIFEPENNMAVYGIEQRPDASHFPWWNHWPVAQLPSDGRYSQASDQASHFSLAWGGPPFHDEDGRIIKARESGSEGNIAVQKTDGRPFKTYWSAWIYGASQQSHVELATLSRSWIQAPSLILRGKEFVSKGYDMAQRAYLVESVDGIDPAAEIEMLFDAGVRSPLVNACILIRGWDTDRVNVLANDRILEKGSGYLSGTIRNLDKDCLVLWLKVRSDSRTKITVRKI